MQHNPFFSACPSVNARSGRPHADNQPPIITAGRQEKSARKKVRGSGKHCATLPPTAAMSRKQPRQIGGNSGCRTDRQVPPAGKYRARQTGISRKIQTLRVGRARPFHYAVGTDCTDVPDAGANPPQGRQNIFAAQNNVKKAVTAKPAKMHTENAYF